MEGLEIAFEFSKEIEGSSKAIFLDSELNEMKKVPAKSLNSALRRSSEHPSIIIIDGTVTSSIIKAAEDAKCHIIVAKNFATTDTNIKLLSL